MFKIIILITIVIVSTGCSLLKEEHDKKEVVQKIKTQDYVDPYLTEDGTIEEVVNIK